MKLLRIYTRYLFLPLVAMCVVMGIKANGQVNALEPTGKGQDLFDGILLEEEDEQSAEILKDLLDSWIENPINVNSDEVSQLVEFGLLSDYQWNRLREYRLIYGDLVSIYELKNIGGWDLQTARRIEPYLTTAGESDNLDNYSGISKTIRHELVYKSAFVAQERKGYLEAANGDTISSSYYSGSPYRMSLRYDLQAENFLRLGIRSEKDAGEPFLVRNEFFKGSYNGPDHLSGFLQLNFRKPFIDLILGDYRLAFGIGLNYSGGNRMFGNRDGLCQPVNRLRPNTSLSESGYLRGAAAQIKTGKLIFTGFGSRINFDGTSLEFDSITGDAISFSAIDASGLHRTLSELENRKKLSEWIYGGTLSYSANWIKTGLICYYNRFEQQVKRKTDPYAIFYFNGSLNLISGMTLSVQLNGLRFISEVSISKNGGYALMAGTEAFPCNGLNISVNWRHFDLRYQNLHGTGYNSSGKNNDESGFQAIFRFETPWRWIIRLMADAARSKWARYQLNAPSGEWSCVLSADRAWRDIGTVFISAKYEEETFAEPGKSIWIDHPAKASRLKIRIEGKLLAFKTLSLKSRIEWNEVFMPGTMGKQGFLILQDIGYHPGRIPLQFWMRICLFESDDYETRIYAYENDVLYDFSSFMHNGKGLRNVWMIRYSPWRWMDCWLRLASVIYSDRTYTGSGWDRAEGNRLDEVELQIRLKLHHQYNFSRFRR